MKKILKQLLLVLAALAVLALAGCDDNEGPMQTAGEKTDNAAEKTGDAVKTGVEKTGDALKTAGDAVKNTVE